jgi:hypothetical protein
MLQNKFKENIINYIEIVLLGLLGLIAIVHYMGLLDMKMYFSGIIFFAICAYVLFLYRETSGDERTEYIKAKTDRYLYLLCNFIISIYILLGIILHFDFSIPLFFLSVMTLSKIIISKILEINN